MQLASPSRSLLFSSSLSHCFSLSIFFICSLALSLPLCRQSLSAGLRGPPLFVFASAAFTVLRIRLASTSAHSRTSSEIDVYLSFLQTVLARVARQEIQTIDRIPHQNHSQASAHFSCILAADCNVTTRRLPFLTHRAVRFPMFLRLTILADVTLPSTRCGSLVYPRTRYFKIINKHQRGRSLSNNTADNCDHFI